MIDAAIDFHRCQEYSFPMGKKTTQVAAWFAPHSCGKASCDLCSLDELGADVVPLVPRSALAEREARRLAIAAALELQAAGI